MFSCNLPPAHLAEWQGLLRATAVTRGWNGYRNKSQHRKLTLAKKILPPLQQGFEPTTFWSRVRRSNHWAIPATQVGVPEFPTRDKEVLKTNNNNKCPSSPMLPAPSLWYLAPNVSCLCYVRNKIKFRDCGQPLPVDQLWHLAMFSAIESLWPLLTQEECQLRIKSTVFLNKILILSVLLVCFGLFVFPYHLEKVWPFCTNSVLRWIVPLRKGCINKTDQSSGTVWKPRWPSWAFRPNEPYGFCGRKAKLNHALALVTVCR